MLLLCSAHHPLLDASASGLILSEMIAFVVLFLDRFAESELVLNSCSLKEEKESSKVILKSVSTVQNA